MALVHIEIESPDTVMPLRPRMFRSYVYLRDKHVLPVLPIGLFLKVGLDGIGVDVYEEHFWELDTLRFKFMYVGLPALDAVEYVQGANWLGVALAALMKIPKDRIAWLGAEALRRITAAPLSDQKRFLLGDCVQAYLPLNEQQQREFERLVTGEPYSGVQAMNVTWYDKGMEKGIEKGRELERRTLLRELLETQFPSLPDSVVERVQQLSASEIGRLIKKLPQARSLQDLGFGD